MRFISLLFACFFPFTVQAITLHASARAATEPQAKREALAALADSIMVEIQSESVSYTEASGKSQQELHIRSRSDVPLIGVEFSMNSSGREVICEASLDSSKSLALYTSKLEQLRQEVNALDQHLAQVKSNERYDLLTKALTAIEQYEKYRVVAQLLGATQAPALARSRISIETELHELERAAPSIELTAQMLSKGVKAEKLYVYPAMPYGSHEVTAFGRLVRDRLVQHFPTVTNPADAQFFFKGDYEILAHGIQLTYRLIDLNGNTLDTRVAMLAPSAYQGVQVKPSSIDFDQLLHQGVAVSSDFRAQITSNRGSEDVLFGDKEEVELLVKLSRPGYFYVVGHVVKKAENESYLLELEHAATSRRFIHYVNADDVNKWLSIGRFEVTAPFGVESLQLVASSDDPINRLPGCQMNNETGLCVIAGNAKQGVALTRALRPKRVEGDAKYQAESVLMFTTMANSAMSGK